MAPRPAAPPFWGWVLVRLAALFVAGLAVVVVFREWAAPLLRGDAAAHQKDHAPAALGR